MSLVNDYFLLYHGMHYESNTPLELHKEDEDLLYELSALILTCDRKNFDKYLGLESFIQIVQKLCGTSISSLDELYHLQYKLIEYIHEHQSLEDINKLHLSFNYLKDESVLNTFKHEKLISLFDPHIFHSFENDSLTDEKGKDFLERKNDLKRFIDELSILVEDTSFEEELEKVKEYLDKEKFSIGITGVMNAGKSTLLNALIGKELLGTSVVPETANLSLLKYTNEPYAKVFYWSKQEWEKIVYSAKEFESIALFVQESEDVFKEELPSYICEDRRVDTILVDELNQYTSAKFKMSNLIKEIELGVELDFLSEGIEIVDTPGLDDVVLQREEITKEYLSRCDLMMHLMNVSQSATKKDIDFIIDALMYQNVGKLLVVLTRADSVKEKELQEVINYTKKSIKSQLHLLNADAKLDFILESLEFVAVSSKMALYHKIGQSELALSQGYTLEKTGILKLETYLNETLYGDKNQKSELIINSAKVRLVKVIETKKKALEFELRLLSKNEGELAKELEVFNLKKDENAELISQMKDEIETYKKQSLVFAKSLEGFLNAEAFRIKQRLNSRLMDDFTYALEKRSKKEFVKSLAPSLEMALKDAFIDLVRDYRYKFVTHSQEVGHKIEREYENYEIGMGQTEDEFSVLDIINKYFKSGLVHSSSAYLTSKLTKLFEAYKSADDSSLIRKLESDLSEAFDVLVEEIRQKSEAISQALLEEFFHYVSKPLQMFEKGLSREEELLSESLIHYEKDEEKRASKAMQIHKQLKNLLDASRKCAL